MSLKQKTVSGLFWNSLSQSGKQISQFVITAILVRLLSPNDFGLLAMALVFANFVAIFGEMGISLALIQKQDTRDRHYYSAFWLNVVVGICLTLTFLGLAPLIAWFYKAPELQPILMVMSVNFLISSFMIIQQTVLIKEMDFRKLAIKDIAVVIISGSIGIGLAYRGFGVWSLVYQMIAFTFVDTVLLWFLSPWRPKFIFEKSDIKDIYNFSANLTGFNIINYLSRNIDQLLIGRLLGAQALGFYSLAYKFLLYPLLNISAVIGKVMFPAFSRIQNDLAMVRKVYLKMVKMISLVSFPLMSFLCLLAPDFVIVIFGSKWVPAIPLIRILCVSAMVQSVNTTVGNIILSQGKARLQLKLGILGFFVIFTSIVIGLKWGLVGVALSYALVSIIWAFFVQSLANSLIMLDGNKFYSVFIDNIMIAFITSLCVASVKFFTGWGQYKMSYLLLNSFVWVTSYCISLFIFKELKYKNRHIILNIFSEI